MSDDIHTTRDIVNALQQIHDLKEKLADVHGTLFRKDVEFRLHEVIAKQDRRYADTVSDGLEKCGDAIGDALYEIGKHLPAATNLAIDARRRFNPSGDIHF